MDCRDASSSNDGIHCVFVGPDRKFYQYQLNYATTEDIPVVKQWTYLLYRDYQADDIQIGDQYIIIKAHSLDDNDNTVLVYRRQDLSTNPGGGFLWGAFNGTEYLDVEWDKVQVQLSEFSNGDKFYIQRREDTGANVYDIGNLKVTINDANWAKQQGNCIQFDKAENTNCVPVGEVWYRKLPNHPGPAEKHDQDNYNLLRIFAWIIAGLILIGIIALLWRMLTASAKPGIGRGASEAEYYEGVSAERGGRVVQEEVTTVERGSTRRGLTQYEDVEEVQFSDNGVSQEEMYGDYSSMPYRESKVIYG